MTPKQEDLFTYGCKSSILQLLKLPDGTVKVLVEGFKRVKINELLDSEKYITCTVEYLEDKNLTSEDLYPLAITTVRRLENYLQSIGRYQLKL